MMLAGAFFYLFAGVVIVSAFMVITSRNPVHSVLFLILAFCNSAGLFMLLGAEFLAMILVIVYVGAVMVLFLFVVMMLDVDFTELRGGFNKFLPVGTLIGAVLLIELIYVLISRVGGHDDEGEKIAFPEKEMEMVTNTEAIGRLLFTEHVLYLEVAGVILLVAMIGAIILTLKHKEGVKRQNIAEQVARSPATSVELKDVKPGSGL